MSDWLEGVLRERAELIEFALEAMTWIEKPTDSRRVQLIRRARKLAALMNEPKPFARFADLPVDQDQPDGSETR